MAEDQDYREQVLEVLNKTDIVEIIGEVVPLIQKGKQIVGLCPFHDDSNPSLDVSREKQVYKCWVCTAGLRNSQGGDALTFVRRYYGMSFRDAMQFLKQKAGMVDVDPNFKAPKKPLVHPVERVKKEQTQAPARSDHYEALDWFASNYDNLLYFSKDDFVKRCVDYLEQKRGLDLDKLREQGFYFGAAPKYISLSQKLPGDLMFAAKEIGLLLNNKTTGEAFDFFRERVIFGIRNESGHVVGFGARYLPEPQDNQADNKKKKKRGGKYINSLQSPVFDKSNLLYGFYENKTGIKNSRTCMVVEGYLDVLSLANNDITNAVSPMGTALAESQIEMIYGNADTMLLCFDGDEAGQMAVAKAVQRASVHFDGVKRVSVLSLPESLDPDGYIKKYGAKEFERFVQNNSVDAKYWWVSHLKRVAAQNGMRYARNEAKDLIESIPNKLQSSEWELAARHAGVDILQLQDNQAENNPKDKVGHTKNNLDLLLDSWSQVLKAASQFPLVACEYRPKLIEKLADNPEHRQKLIDLVLKFDQATQKGMQEWQNKSNKQESDNPVIAAYTSRQTRLLSNSVELLDKMIGFYQSENEKKSQEKLYCDGKLSDVEYLSALQQNKLKRAHPRQ